MRIKGYGSGTGNFGSGGSRSDLFRGKHRLGQKIHGKLIKNIADNMAWVDFNGDRLLAQLATPHPEGSLLLFIIKQLRPQIVLKEITTGYSEGANTLTLASAFDTARALFENRFTIKLRSNAPIRPLLTITDFMFFLAADAELFSCYMDAANCARSISDVLKKSKRGRVVYQPWLAPECRRQVTLVRNVGEQAGMTESIVEFDHNKMGMVRIELLHKDTTVAYKLKMQRPKHGSALLKYLSTKDYSATSLKLQSLGVTKLPQSGHGGIIAELLFRA
ncbi:hypothetical protein [uncultured Pseudodesulfovibrio sp.]|uniref:hypothetical protein n=1 Tax=uncultured Pseudodesulfovibrio sp. TaxID=2035858 RepID=UPI0029C9AEBC|nr:hypothetical protein [uncultured Pseudodesulfovibrio sp.]